MSVNLAADSARSSFSQRFFFFLLWFAGCCFVFLQPVIHLIRYSLSDENASHLILVPFIAAWILFLERDQIFSSPSSDYASAGVFVCLSALAGFFALFFTSSWSQVNQLSLYIAALVCSWIAGFSLFFGRPALRAGRFSLTLLFLTVPIPDFLLDNIIYFLQRGSTEITALLFDLTGVPVLRDGFVFHLPRANIEVARECSGIRSSLALLILALVVAHFYLRRFWRQAVFIAVGLLVMIVKNGVRIVTLTLLASYVDPGFLYGRLHREGGAVFFLLGLALLIPVLWLLQRSETRTGEQAKSV